MLRIRVPATRLTSLGLAPSSDLHAIDVEFITARGRVDPANAGALEPVDPAIPRVRRLEDRADDDRRERGELAANRTSIAVWPEVQDAGIRGIDPRPVRCLQTSPHIHERNPVLA